jgi:hypothetical protein
MRLLLFFLLVAAGLAVAADNPEPKDRDPLKPREITVKGLTGGKGSINKPDRIASKEDLAKAVTDKEVRAAIAKQVDFKKEYLLLFRWSGSGGDKLQVAVEKEKKGEVAVFTRKRGLTRDLRRHVRLFAVPAKMEYKVKP